MESVPQPQEKSLVFGNQVVKFEYSKLSPLARNQLNRLLRKLQLERNLIVGSNPKKYEIKIKELLETEGALIEQQRQKYNEKVK